MSGGGKRVLFGALVPNSMDFSDGMIIVRCQRKRLQSFAKIRVRKMKGCEQMDNIENENFYNKVIELFQNGKKNYQLQ